MPGLDGGEGEAVKVRAFLSMREYAELIGEVWEGQDPGDREEAMRRLRRRAKASGLCERVPGGKRSYRISTARLKRLEADAYADMMEDVRYWEDGCPHPFLDVRDVASGVKWCGGCGGLNNGSGWRLSRSQEMREV